MASNISEIDGTVQTYWTMVTLDEMIKEVPEKLAEKLNSDGVTPGEPLRFEKYVELATKGGINQLTVLQRNNKFFGNKDENRPGRF